MRMSTKGRFAVNALIDLALREAAGPVALATISARQQVSLSYLEQLFSRLRRDGIVESTRGPGGGYSLGRAPEEISVADIVSSVDDPLESTEGESAADPLRCPRHQNSLARQSPRRHARPRSSACGITYGDDAVHERDLDPAGSLAAGCRLRHRRGAVRRDR